MNIDGMSDEDIGRTIKEAYRQQSAARREAIRTQSGLAAFLDDIGLKDLADMVRAAARVWNEVWNWIKSRFS